MKLWIVAAVSTLRLPSTAALRVPSAVVSRRALGELASAAALATGGARAAAAAAAVPTLAIGKSKLEVSQLIQGYWQLAGGHGAYTEAEAIANMRAHLAAGATTLDTADIYGPSELVVGKFVAEEKRAVACTKFCCFQGLDSIDRSQVRARVKKQLSRLQVPQLPLVAFFWSDYGVKRYTDVGLYLTELKEEGFIREIGVTNFDLTRVKALVDAGVPVASNQVQLSALDRRPVQSGMARYCADQGIKLVAFGTVGAGLLSERALGASSAQWTDFDNISQRMYSGTATRFGSWSLVQSLLQTLAAIAKEHPGASIANVAQRYVLQRSDGADVALLVGVRNTRHIADNVRTFSFSLSDGELAAIDKVVAQRSGPKGDVWDLERGRA